MRADNSSALASICFFSSAVSWCGGIPFFSGAFCVAGACVKAIIARLMANPPTNKSGFIGSPLLRPAEEAPVNRLRENVTLNRFHHVGARFECVGGWFHVQLGIQSIDLKHIVVERTIRGGSRTTVHG